jgi:hypothetical protein
MVAIQVRRSGQIQDTFYRQNCWNWLSDTIWGIRERIESRMAAKILT